MAEFEKLKRFIAHTKGRSDGQPGFIEVEPYVRHYSDCDIYSLTPVCTCGLLMELEWIHPYEDRIKFFPDYHDDQMKQRWLGTKAIEDAILKFEKENPPLTDEEAEERLGRFLEDWDGPSTPYVEPPRRYMHFYD